MPSTSKENDDFAQQNATNEIPVAEVIQNEFTTTRVLTNQGSNVQVSLAVSKNLDVTQSDEELMNVSMHITDEDGTNEAEIAVPEIQVKDV